MPDVSAKARRWIIADRHVKPGGCWVKQTYGNSTNASDHFENECVQLWGGMDGLKFI
jgi:hypothetical protein